MASHLAGCSCPGKRLGRRDAKPKWLPDLELVKYATALKDLDTVTHEVAVWADATATGDEAGDRHAWEAITRAYVSLNKVRLLAGRNEAGETMHRLLREYRDVLEHHERTLPQTRDLWTTSIDEFRVDLHLARPSE